jgi:hypothetical protein
MALTEGIASAEVSVVELLPNFRSYETFPCNLVCFIPIFGNRCPSDRCGCQRRFGSGVKLSKLTAVRMPDAHLRTYFRGHCLHALLCVTL